MKKIIKGINIIVSLIFIIIAAAIAYIAIPIFGNQALIVRSGSMMPTIDIGSLIVVRPPAASANAPKYNKGDIIAFRTDKDSKTIVTHRVTSIESGKDGVFYQTKGDANSAVDGWSIDQQNILGKVNYSLPYVGQILAFAKTGKGMALLIVLPAIIVILMELITIIKEIRKKRKNANVIPDLIGDPESKTNKFNLFRPKIIIPVIGAIAFTVPFTIAFLNDTETSSNNIIQAAASFATPTPIQVQSLQTNSLDNTEAPPTPTITPTPTATEEPTPTPTDTPTPTPTTAIEPVQNNN